MLSNVFEHKIEVDYVMADRQKSTSTCVDPTISDFDCLPEKKYGKSRFGNLKRSVHVGISDAKNIDSNL